MARKFLYLVAILIGLFLLVLLALRLFPDRLAQAALVPSEPFQAQQPPAPNVYADAAMWYARPGAKNDPSLWRPTGLRDDAGAPPAPTITPAVFVIHPTSYLNRAHWNAPLDDAESTDRARLLLKAIASPFAVADKAPGAGTVWAPRYRQATFGAFLTSDVATRDRALEVAYADVVEAFRQFVAEAPKDQPIILVGHSQGALHLMRLMREKVNNTPLRQRLVAAYVIGWPVSVTGDLPAMGVLPCTTPTQTSCALGWQSFAEPAETAAIQKIYDGSTGFDGKPRKGTPMLCTNPLTGGAVAQADKAANLGGLVADLKFTSAKLTPAIAPARCDTRGWLLIGSPPNVGPYVLPGNNYHVYDVPLFWENVRRDALKRAAAFVRR